MAIKMAFYTGIQTLYDNTIRDYLPRKSRVLAGVDVRDMRLFDLSGDQPGYKEGLMEGIDRVVQDGDTVDLVGLGRGVSTVVAAQSGASAITAYEASGEMIDLAKDTIENNDTGSANIQIEHAAVGEPIDVWGSYDSADTVSPTSLTDADVLVLDCEGAETEILKDLGSKPSAVVCETHPNFGSPTEDTTEVLEEYYNVDLLDYKLDESTWQKIAIAT